MIHYQFVVEHYTSRLLRVVARKMPARTEKIRPKTMPLSSVPNYLREVTGSSSQITQQQINRMSQYIQEYGEALVDLVNDFWVVTPMDKEKVSARYPHRKLLLASKLAATYLLRRF